ncbi:MAG: NADP-dependent oxidoreductase [Candidatus Eremiobacteraeota bacterium]|nr:NADP-dependent oxidoreductase [Candidatus Eremiobacteraeota bacterium]
MTNLRANHRVLLASRPTGEPTLENFAFVEAAVPTPAPAELLLRTIYLSLDPYMRGRMNAAKSYAAPVEVGEVMVGGAVSEVVASNVAGFDVGAIVEGRTGWQDYALSDGSDVRIVDRTLGPLSTALGVLGMPGMTAYTGLLNIGRPQAGETVVVAAAAGPVGSAVGQIARLKGARAVGIAGGAAKCAYVTGELGFDACIDHRAPEFAERLHSACPRGIDVYFENVGGAVLESVVPLLNPFARVPVCGLIAWYNATTFPGPDRLPGLMRAILSNRVLVRGFIVSDFAAQHQQFLSEVGAWVRAGTMRYREDFTDGLASAPRAFIGMLRGDNFGKAVVRVSSE